jgi:hypothetical protein
MRNFLFIIFLLVQVLPVSMADEIIKFTPLRDNERFAYTTQTQHGNLGRVWQRMTMFAVRDNNIENVTELFTWEPVRHSDIQFTSDFKKGFFIESNIIRWDDSDLYHLYMVNGFTGDIRKLLPDIGLSSGFRVSKDGKFILFLGSSYPTRDFMDFFLFDVENEVMLGEFEWRPNRQFLPWGDPIHSWRVRRSNNIFWLLATVAEFIVAAAEFDPITMELKTFYSTLDESGFPSLPIRGDEGWSDDVAQYHRNPNVRLQR